MIQKGVYKYFYSSDVGLNPAYFGRHKSGNWDFYTSKTSALPLKMIFNENNYVYESVATKIIEKPLFKTDFNVKLQ